MDDSGGRRGRRGGRWGLGSVCLGVLPETLPLRFSELLAGEGKEIERNVNL